VIATALTAMDLLFLAAVMRWALLLLVAVGVAWALYGISNRFAKPTSDSPEGALSSPSGE